MIGQEALLFEKRSKNFCTAVAELRATAASIRKTYNRAWAMSRYVPINGSPVQGRAFGDFSLHDTAGVLEIILVDELSRKVCVTFNDFIAYRQLDADDS